jgi:3-deoxy-D-manno-octulosonic-acid transferase
VLLATVLREFHDPTICFIVVPHNVDPKSIVAYRSQFAEPMALYSEHAFQSAHRILLVDRIGMLSSLYRYADLALVGGGFKTGLHNVLEPAIYSIPVLIGPNYHKFPEASALVEKGGVIVVTNSDDLELYLQTLARQPRVLEELGIQNRLGIEESSGATDRIYDRIKAFL